MLTVLKKEVMFELVEQVMSKQDNQTTEELYAEMFNQQPAIKEMVLTALSLNKSDEWKDGYCKGVFQIWYLLNQQSIIDDLEQGN